MSLKSLATVRTMALVYLCPYENFRRPYDAFGDVALKGLF